MTWLWKSGSCLNNFLDEDDDSLFLGAIPSRKAHLYICITFGNCVHICLPTPLWNDILISLLCICLTLGIWNKFLKYLIDFHGWVWAPNNLKDEHFQRNRIGISSYMLSYDCPDCSFLPLFQLRIQTAINRHLQVPTVYTSSPKEGLSLLSPHP